MRSFFKSELETLKIKTGLNQYETLSAQGADTITKLLDALCMVCDGFAYIPDKDKERIIQAAIISDQDFTGLNARVIWKWLNAQSAKYYKEEAHKETAPTPNPVTYDELSLEAKEEVDDFVRRLRAQKNGFRTVPEVSQAEIDALRIEDLEEREGPKAESVGVHYTSQEQIIRNQRKIEWARQFTDLQTGKVKEGAPTFEEWIKKQIKNDTIQDNLVK